MPRPPTEQPQGANHPKPIPERPFQEITVDLSSYGGWTYLIIADCFTDWPAIISLDHVINAIQITSAIHQSFCHTAIPDVVWSDRDPNLPQNFSQTLLSSGASYTKYLPHATHKATTKLNQWRNSSMLPGLADHLTMTNFVVPYYSTASRKHGLSPLQKLFGHPVQDILPAHHQLFLPKWQCPIATSK